MRKSTVSKLLNEETLLTERWTLERASLGKRKRDGKDPEFEEALNLWFRAVLTKGIRISGPILKNKDEELAQMLGRSDFVATDGWLSRWKTRHTIKYKRAHVRRVVLIWWELKSGCLLFSSAPTRV